MGLDLVEIWNNMSIIVKVITVLMVGMSVFMFYVIAERLLTYRAASDQSIRYVQALGGYLSQHKVDDARSRRRDHRRDVVQLLHVARRAVRDRHERHLERVHRLRAARGPRLNVHAKAGHPHRRWRLSNKKANIDHVRNDINVTPLV